MDRRTFLAGAAVVAVPITPAAAKPYNPEDALRLAAAEIRKAMKALGVESYMVMVREEESGIAKAMDFNRNGGLRQMREIA